MSLDKLVSSDVSLEDQDRYKSFDSTEVCVDKYPDLIFIASLWSGRSRMAFRTIAEAMAKAKDCRLQLIDSDSLLGQVLMGLLPVEHHGNGILISFEQGLFRFVGSGKDLEQLKTANCFLPKRS
jgi:hypothetical protein